MQSMIKVNYRLQMTVLGDSGVQYRLTDVDGGGTSSAGAMTWCFLLNFDVNLKLL